MKHLLLLSCLLSAAITGSAQFTGMSDTSFGDRGRFYFTLPSGSGGLTASKLMGQDDGGVILIAAPKIDYYNPGNDGNISYVFRLRPNGTPDNSFGDPVTPGYIRVGGSRGGISNKVRFHTGSITADNKILVAGYHYNVSGGSNNTYNIIVMRLHQNGRIDSSFGSNGFVSHNMKPLAGQLNHEARSMALQPDGKILLGGYFSRTFSYDQVFICRLHTDGRIDSSFNSVGYNIDIPIERRGRINSSVALQSDGNILLCGTLEVYTSVYLPEYLAIARLKPNGTIDSSFGTDGLYATNYTKGSDKYTAYGMDMKIMPDDRIVAGGSMQFNDGNMYRYATSGVRTGRNGEVDTSFRPRYTEPSNHGLQMYHYDTNVATQGLPQLETQKILIGRDSSLLFIGASTYAGDKGLMIKTGYRGRTDTAFGEDGYFFWGIDTANAVTSFTDALFQHGTGRLLVCGDNDSTGQYGVFVTGFAYGDTTEAEDPEEPEEPEEPGFVQTPNIYGTPYLSPNPFRNELTLQGMNPSEAVVVSVYDITGRLAWRQEVTGSSSYRIVPSLPAARNPEMIVVVVQTGSGTFTKKMLRVQD